MSLRVIGWALLLAAGCGGGGSGAPDGATDAAADASRDGGPRDAAARDGAADGLPEASAFLPVGRYDCTAEGPFVAPERPHPLGCFADPECTSRLVAGHRIATTFAPENGLSALRAAILLGVDIVETDIRLSADGHVVLMHDGEVDRTTDGTGEVDALTLEQLRAITLVPGPGVPEGDFSCEHPPTLDEVFALARGQIVVELEVKDEQAGVRAAAYLRDEGLQGQAFLLCDPTECAALRAEVPDAPIMTRPREVAEVDAELGYDPPPRLVHVDVDDAFLAGDVVARIHGAGAKVYGNAFTDADAAAALLGELDRYGPTYERGVDALQSQFPHWALLALGRLERP